MPADQGCVRAEKGGKRTEVLGLRDGDSFSVNELCECRGRGQ